MRASIHILTAIFLLPSPALAQETAQQRIENKIKLDKDSKIITLVYENDLIGSGTDQHYTNGVRLSYMDISSKVPQIAHRIAEAIPTFSINATTSTFYSLGQNMYTPKNINTRSPNPNDRPWAGYLYGSIGMVTLTDNHIDELETSLGIVGSHSIAQQTQKFVHRHVTNSPIPKGWSNGLNNEPALMFGWKRSFPTTLEAHIASLYLNATPHYGLTLGNVYTFANTGLTLSISPSADSLQDTPVRVRPALAGTGYFQRPNNDYGLSWQLFAGVDARAMGRNIFLDGNTFSDSHDIDKKYFVADINAGASITFNNIRFSYTMVSRTKEFQGQDSSDIFGAISISTKF